jgi:hypothetical protein
MQFSELWKGKWTWSIMLERPVSNIICPCRWPLPVIQSCIIGPLVMGREGGHQSFLPSCACVCACVRVCVYIYIYIYIYTQWNLYKAALE